MIIRIYIFSTGIIVITIIIITSIVTIIIVVIIVTIIITGFTYITGY